MGGDLPQPKGGRRQARPQLARLSLELSRLPGCLGEGRQESQLSSPPPHLSPRQAMRTVISPAAAFGGREEPLLMSCGVTKSLVIPGAGKGGGWKRPGPGGSLGLVPAL